jgi:catechol 2,3-dioxygenase-like lactoylglutathione lyase family enzyme
MNINGVAHVQITVNDFERCVEFYEKLFAYFEMTVIARNPNLIYGVGGRTGIAISRCAAEHRNEKFVQGRIGLHHLCFRARERDDVDRVYDFLRSIDAKIVHSPEDGRWAPGYYSVLFEDPDGIRLEVNHVPGKGNLAPNIRHPIDL